MSIFGFKKKKDEKLEQGAQVAKSSADKGKNTKLTKRPVAVSKQVKTEKISASKLLPSLKSDVDSLNASIIIRPKITEKSGIMSQEGVYTFEVIKHANKNSIKKAFLTLYKVNPVNVKTLNIPAKEIFVRGKKGMVAGYKKAIITVKKGEKIDFV